mgnify:FL=1
MVFTAVIADDITGANDIGIMYAKEGLDTAVYSYSMLDGSENIENTVSIIDTNSRFLSGDEAYRKVYDALKYFKGKGVKQYFNKQCSVFRGNIGAEFDAMLDCLGEENGLVVLGFPDNGRTTVHGIHYVYGVELAASQFSKDPVHPMTESDLVSILQKQTKRTVGLISYEAYEQELEEFKAYVQEQKKQYNYLIFDVRDNDDLAYLAQAFQEEKVLCGSSAIGRYLGKLYTERENRILSIAGSLTGQTKAQIRYMKEHGYPVIELNTYRLFRQDEKKKELERILKEYAGCREENRLVLVCSMHEEEQVAETKRIANEYGISNTQVSGLVSEMLGEIALHIAQTYHITRYIICGGDTSAAFCNKLSIYGMRIEREIQPGLPSCISLKPPYYHLVLKSGSFGSESFVEEAMNYI